MNQRPESLADLPWDSAQQVDAVCDKFEAAYRSGRQPRIEEFLDGTSEPERSVLFGELLKLEIQIRLKHGTDSTLVLDDYRIRFPDLKAVVDAVFKVLHLPPPSFDEKRSPLEGAQAPAAVHSADPSQELILPYQLGVYLLEKRIGHGGMGTVYRAIHQALDRPVAIKLMQRERLLRPEAVSRFQREMRAVAKLHHPNIVMAYDAGDVQGMHFLAMECVSGWDLASISQCCGPLPIPVACECVLQAAKGLQHVFEHGLVHRDIKPSNLMLTTDGDVKLLDLGLARLREDERDERLTHDSSPMGTIEYMAPEQARNPHEVDIRADLYSLGCTLFKLLCGFSPFSRPSRSTIQLLSAHLEATPPALRDSREETPLALEDLVNRLLCKPPADRPQTPAEVVAALQPFASNGMLKTFASSLQGIADANGRLPRKAAPGVKTATGIWEPPPVETNVAFLDTQAAAEPDDGPHSTVTPWRRRSWMIATASVGLGLVALYFGRPHEPRATDLLTHLDLDRNAILGKWSSNNAELLSPLTGPACIRLATVDDADFRLELTVKSVEGSSRWTLVHSGDPRFAIEFGPTVQTATDETGARAAANPSPHNWPGDWGDFADPSPRRFLISVKGSHFTLDRDGQRLLDVHIPAEGDVNCPLLPPAALQRPGIYLLTDASQLRFSQVRWTSPLTGRSP